MRARVPAVLCVLALGCGAAEPRSATTAARAQAGAPDPTAQAAGVAANSGTTDLRQLPAYPSFADLVDAARRLDDTGQTHGAAACLLRGERSLRFEADVSAGVRPLPAAPAELVSLLDKAAGPIAVLSSWGASAGESSPVTLVALTTTTTAALTQPSVTVFLTSKGAYLRCADSVCRAHPEAMPLTAAVSWLAQVGAPSTTVYVSAEAAVALAQVRELLRTLPARYEVALAVALPKGTRLPPPAPQSGELLCPDGLAELAADAQEGDLPVPVLQSALAPLHDAALSCALATGGRASLGGRLLLDLRIAPDGSVTALCLEHDEIGELALRRCLVESARSLRFPKPEPSGFVDLSVPLQLQLQGPTAQRALCE
ncbi:MAG TPA: hypothetical protein VF331_06980 [Polyangiales bacterium]